MAIENKSKEIDTEVVNKKEVKKQLKLIGTMKPQRGHKLFKVCVETLEISLVEFEKSSQTITWSKASKKDFSGKKKVIQKPGFIYISALNVKNVKKVLRRDYSINLK